MSTSFGQSTSTGPDGGFSLDATLPADTETVEISVSAEIGGDRFVGETDPLPIIADGITDAGLITLELSQFVPITINFDAGFSSPRTYAESGLTVTSLQTHLHFDSPPGSIWNHSGCCSTPYRFEFGGAPFNVVSLQVVQHNSGTHTFQSSSGDAQVLSGVGQHSLPVAGWQGITSFTWSAAGTMAIDNLVIEVTP